VYSLPGRHAAQIGTLLFLSWSRRQTRTSACAAIVLAMAVVISGQMFAAEAVCLWYDPHLAGAFPLLIARAAISSSRERCRPAPGAWRPPLHPEAELAVNSRLNPSADEWKAFTEKRVRSAHSTLESPFKHKWFD
jgi:hypothetical protein